MLRVCGQLTCEPPTSWSTSVHFRQREEETRPAVRTAEGTAAMPSWDNRDYLNASFFSQTVGVRSQKTRWLYAARRGDFRGIFKYFVAILEVS